MAVDISAVSTLQNGRLLHWITTSSSYGARSTHQPSSSTSGVEHVTPAAARDWPARRARDPGGGGGGRRLAGVAVTHVGDVDEGPVDAGEVQLLVGAQFEAAQRRPIQLRGFQLCESQSRIQQANVDSRFRHGAVNNSRCMCTC